MNKSDKVKNVFNYLKTVLLASIVFYLLGNIAVIVGGKAFEVFWEIFSWVSCHVNNVVFCGLLQLIVLAAILLILLLSFIVFGAGACIFGFSFVPKYNRRIK